MGTEALSLWEKGFTTNQLLTKFVGTLSDITGRMDRSTKDISVPRSLLAVCHTAGVCPWTTAGSTQEVSGGDCSSRAGGLHSMSTQASQMILDAFEIYIMIMAFRVKHFSEELLPLGKCTFTHVWLHLGCYLYPHSRKWMEDLPPQSLMPAAFSSSIKTSPGYWYQPVVVGDPSRPSTALTLQQPQSPYSCSASHPKSRTALSSDTSLFSTEWKGT